MADPWSITMAALALLGQTPSFFDQWQKFIKKLREQSGLSKKEADESEIVLLESRTEWLLHKIMLLDLVVAFSKEHIWNEKVAKYCESERPVAYEEYKKVKNRLEEFGELMKNNK